MSHILGCEIGATEGDILVFGHSVSEDPDTVRKLVSVCKQDDYLYPDLTAREHLECFAGLRGVPSHEVPEMVQRWLASVDLATVQNQYTSSFSGGMKRRLSLACSTIGGRSLIILDEPTTGEFLLMTSVCCFLISFSDSNLVGDRVAGMDPLSRRAVWRHIDEIKEGRVVLLTTHAMEEADLLADTVAVRLSSDLLIFSADFMFVSR